MELLAGVLVSLTSAILYAVGGVLQHRAIARQARSAFDSAGVVRGVRQPMWVVGLAIQAAAIGVQLVALGMAPLVLVQTVLVTMVFWVPLCAGWLEHVSLGADVWLGSVVVAVGVVGFVLASHPAAVERHANPWRWAAATALALGCCAIATLVARRLSAGPAAAVLGASAGILNVLGAALASAALIVLSHDGWQGMVTSWLPYGAAAVLLLSIAATAIAFAAGPVTASIPPMIAANPIVGALIGIVLLGEPWPGGAVSLVVAALALLTMIGGIVLLSRTRALAEQLQ